MLPDVILCLITALLPLKDHVCIKQCSKKMKLLTEKPECSPRVTQLTVSIKNFEAAMKYKPSSLVISGYLDMTRYNCDMKSVQHIEGNVGLSKFVNLKSCTIRQACDIRRVVLPLIDCRKIESSEIMRYQLSLLPRTVTDLRCGGNIDCRDLHLNLDPYIQLEKLDVPTLSDEIQHFHSLQELTFHHWMKTPKLPSSIHTLNAEASYHDWLGNISLPFIINLNAYFHLRSTDIDQFAKKIHHIQHIPNIKIRMTTGLWSNQIPEFVLNTITSLELIAPGLLDIAMKMPNLQSLFINTRGLLINVYGIFPCWPHLHCIRLDIAEIKTLYSLLKILPAGKYTVFVYATSYIQRIYNYIEKHPMPGSFKIEH